MAESKKLTLSVVTADVGGLVGHCTTHPEVLDTAKERLYAARGKREITDYHVLRCGDDVNLIVTHANGADDRKTHELFWNILKACRETARELKLHAYDRGLSKEPFTGSIKCAGPGIAEIEFLERESEPVLVFMSNKASRGAWNMPLYRIFADPFTTPGLFLDPAMLEGFTFCVRDLKEDKVVDINTPRELHLLLALISSTRRYVVVSVARTADAEVCATISTEKYDLVGGEVAWRTEPAVIFRCHTGFPSVGEVMEGFATPHLVEGWMRCSHTGPLMPVPFYEANPTRFDGPPRVISAGFQICEGRLTGPHDMFDDPSFDEARKVANMISGYLRAHGPFQPHTLPEPEKEYTTLPIVAEILKERFRKA